MNSLYVDTSKLLSTFIIRKVLFIFLFISPNNLFGQQTSYSPYLQAGVSFSNYQTESRAIYKPNPDNSHFYVPKQIADYLIGFGAEAGITKSLSDVYFMNLGIRFSQQGGEIKYRDENTNLKHKYLFNTLTVPISFGIQTRINSHLFKVHVGGYYGHILSASYTFQKESTDILRKMTKNIIGYQLGAQYLFPTTYLTYLGLSLNYTGGNLNLLLGEIPNETNNILMSGTLFTGLVYQF